MPNFSKVFIVLEQFLNPVSISTMVGRFVTLAICFDLLLTSSKEVNPMSG